MSFSMVLHPCLVMWRAMSDGILKEILSCLANGWSRSKRRPNFPPPLPEDKSISHLKMLKRSSRDSKDQKKIKRKPAGCMLSNLSSRITDWNSPSFNDVDGDKIVKANMDGDDTPLSPIKMTREKRRRKLENIRILLLKNLHQRN